MGLVPPAAAAAAGKAEQAYRQCPASQEILARAADLSWNPGSSRIDRHRTLRQRLGVALPEGSGRILLYSVGAHHTSVEYSVIATRSASGIWHTDGVGQIGPALLQIEPAAMPPLSRDLSPDDSHTLDGLLEQGCLYAGPTYLRDPGIAAGGAEQTLEIETSRHHWIGSWFGLQTAEEERVIRLIANR